MPYKHTQYAPLFWVLIAVAALEVWFAYILQNVPMLTVLMLVFSAFTLALAFSFKQLSIWDAGDALAFSFGPLPLVRKRIPYADIVAVEPARSDMIDGWGIHYIPTRGWIYNVWGFDCVRIVTRKRTLRLGTDDRDNLVAFLQSKITAPVNG